MSIRIGTTENEARYHHYGAVVERAEFDWVGTIRAPFDDECLSRIDALIVSCDQHLPNRLAISACRERGIPTFHVLDGVLDWRTTFADPETHPDEDRVPLLRPGIADLIFAMGGIQRDLALWLGCPSVVSTGFPRWDSLPRQPCRRGATNGKPRLLVATANTPWKTPEQREAVISTFRQLVKGLESLATEIVLTFRVADELAESIGVVANHAGSAADAIEECDAVITSPSTFAVESMLVGRPTLVFDPFAFPVLTPSAWAATDVARVLRELDGLFAPSEERASFQDFLANKLVTPGNAGERVAAAIVNVCDSSSHNGKLLDDLTEEARGEILTTRKSWTEEQLRSLAATIPDLEREIVRRDQEIQEWTRSYFTPSLRFVLGTIWRFIKRPFPARKH